jgi:hypothetical protein
MFKLLISTVLYYESQFYLEARKNGSPGRIYLISTGLLIALTLVLYIPLFFVAEGSWHLMVLPLISALLSLIPVVRYRSITGIEALDKKILSLSLARSDYKTAFKTSPVFVLQTAGLIALIIELYAILNYILCALTPSLAFSSLLFLVPVSTAMVLVSIIITMLIFHAINRSGDEHFVKIETYNRQGTFLPVIVAILITLILSVLLIFLAGSIFKYSVITISISIAIGLPAGIISSILMHRNKLFTRSRWIIIMGRGRALLNDKIKSINSASIFSLFRSSYILLPFLAAMLAFILLSLISILIPIDYKLRLIQSLVTGLYFSYPLLKRKISYSDLHKPFTFTLFLFIMVQLSTIFALLSSIKPLGDTSPLLFAHDFINPLINGFALAATRVTRFYSAIPLPLYLLIPALFLVLLLASMKLYSLLLLIGRKVDDSLKASLNRPSTTLLFGDSISLYPTLFSMFGAALLSSVLLIESRPAGMLFAGLIETFQVAQVFNLDFLILENIQNFIHTIIIIAISVIGVRLGYQFVCSLLSHFMLFGDELVYLENKLFTKSVMRIPLSRINYIICRQNIIDKFFDVGTIYIETSDKNGLIKIKGVSSIKEKNILIMDKIKGAV